MPTTKKGAKASDETTDDVQQEEKEEEAPAEENPPEEKEEKGSRVSADVALTRNVALQRVIRTMMNGAASLSPNSNAHPFSPHTGFMALLLAAYTARNQTEFLRVLEQYLQHAILHVSQSGRREEIPGVMQEIRGLMEHPHVGFEATARYLLPRVNMPL